MADPLTITGTAIGILKNTTDALSALRERAQRSKDTDIKEQINALYNNVLSLNEVISRLLDENKALRRQLELQQHPPEAPKIRQVGETNYYFKGDEGPFCQPCYDTKNRLVILSPQQHRRSGSTRRDCPVCHQTFYEKKEHQQVRLTPRVERYT
jgi:DNA repair exonuclease SbcCD ATPase subunit